LKNFSCLLSKIRLFQLWIGSSICFKVIVKPINEVHVMDFHHFLQFSYLKHQKRVLEFPICMFPIYTRFTFPWTKKENTNRASVYCTEQLSKSNWKLFLVETEVLNFVRQNRLGLTWILDPLPLLLSSSNFTFISFSWHL
jgi:hypothetical protein